jgi:predicted nicotinamide N-methyase
MKTAATRFILCVLALLIGCRRYREDLDYDHEVLQVWPEVNLANPDLYQFTGVSFDSDSIAPLRALITDQSVVANQRILDLDAQTGVLSLLSSQFDAKSVIAIADSPDAFACVRYNLAAQQAELADVGCKIDIRQTSPIDLVKSESQFTMILLAVDANNRDRLPEFLDAIRTGLATGGRALVVGLSDEQIKELKPSLRSRGLVDELLTATIGFEDRDDEPVAQSGSGVKSKDVSDDNSKALPDDAQTPTNVVAPVEVKKDETVGDFVGRVLELKIDSVLKVKQEKAQAKKSSDK